ncbi:MAG: flagellar basal-body rod protein FlgF [Myxococcota bacterium]
MGTDMYVALSGALGRIRELEVLSNNLANAQTVGFKRDRTSFVATLESALRTAGGESAPGAGGHVFTALDSERFDPRAGAIEATGNRLDVAIDGPGYFSVQTPEGIRYTRAGAFSIDGNRQLVTSSGFPVLGEGGPIRVGRADAEIRANGEVVLPSIDLESPPSVVGRLRIVEFDDPEVLVKQGASLLRAEDGVEPRAADETRLAERSLERSNVDPVRELAELVIVQRSFDMAMQMLQADDEASRRLIQEVSS